MRFLMTARNGRVSDIANAFPSCITVAQLTLRRKLTTELGAALAYSESSLTCYRRVIFIFLVIDPEANALLTRAVF